MTVGNFTSMAKKLFVQGLFDISATPKEDLGAVRELNDGRKFVYSRAGAVALVAGNLLQNAVVVANHLNCAVAAAAAVDAKEVSVTLGATAAAADLYKDGYLHVNAADGIGHLYKIRGHKAIGSGGTGTILLYDGIRVALTTSSKVTLTKHPNDGVIVMPTTQTGMPIGVAPIPVTAAYYFWAQVKGPACVNVVGTVVVGNDVIPGTGTAGSVIPAGIDDIVGAVGRVIRVNATTEDALIQLAIPGY